MAFDYGNPVWIYQDDITNIQELPSQTTVELSKYIGISQGGFNYSNLSTDPLKRFLSNDGQFECLIMSYYLRSGLSFNQCYSKDKVVDGSRTILLNGNEYYIFVPSESDVESIYSYMRGDSTKRYYTRTFDLSTCDMVYFENESSFRFYRGFSRNDSDSDIHCLKLLFIRRINNLPSIVVSTDNLGEISQFNTLDYEVIDLDADTVTIKEFLDSNLMNTHSKIETPISMQLSISSSNWDELSYGKHTIRIEAIDINNGISEKVITFVKIKEPITILPTTVSLKQTIVHNTEIYKEIDYQLYKFEKVLKEKGIELLPSEKKLTILISKVEELYRGGSGYLPNQPFTCELGYMDLPQKFIFLHYYDDKMKLFCRDDSRRGDIYYNTIDLKTGVSDGWQKTSDSNLGIVVNSYRYPIRGKHSENNWIARATSSGSRYHKVDSSTFVTTQITDLNDCVTTRTSAIYRVGDILYYFKVTSPGTGIYVKLNSYDLTTNIVTELYDFKSQRFSVDPKSITVDGDNLYFHLSKQGENRNVYFYKYSLSENSLEELGVAQVNDINLDLLKGSYVVYKKDKLYVISGYLTSDSNRCKILEFDIQSKLYKSHIFSLGHSSLGPNMSLENYVTGDNENIWLTGVTSLETDTLFLRLNIN